MLNDMELNTGVAELMEFGKRMANAASLLAKMRDEDVQIAQTPREEIHRIAGRVLYRITLNEQPRVKVPVLVTYAMVGNWRVLDLQDDRSLLRKLAEAGCDVYVIDWGHPTRADQFDDFGDLINVYMDGFVDVIRERRGMPEINLLGICQGGLLSLCYAALHPKKIRNLITAVTPVDFHADQKDERADTGFMNVWTRALEPQDLDLLIEAMGNIPGELGGTMFSLMTPFRTLTKYNMTLIQAGQDQDALLNFLRMEKWLADRPDHTGEAAQQWLKDLYQQNKLVRGEFFVDGRHVDLRAVTMPILNIYSETDTIIHPLSSKALRSHVASSDYTEMPMAGGHIGVLVARSRKIPDGIADWLHKH
jgi:poly[(R)-3-hydroxyalkanoate] polymerase subunit PhaC